MVKWYFKIILEDGNIGYMSFRANDKLAAYAHVRKYSPDTKEIISLTEEEYLKLTSNL